jgi:hypothetical protein
MNKKNTKDCGQKKIQDIKTELYTRTRDLITYMEKNLAFRNSSSVRLLEIASLLDDNISNLTEASLRKEDLLEEIKEELNHKLSSFYGNSVTLLPGYSPKIRPILRIGTELHRWIDSLEKTDLKELYK